METRYYVTSIEFNKVAQAENRTVPFSFTDIDQAEKKFYRIYSDNINNPTLSWCNVVMWDNYGNLIDHKYWHEREQAQAE